MEIGDGTNTNLMSMPVSFSTTSSASSGHSAQMASVNSSRWANSGVDINLDNLLHGTPKKSNATPMNKMEVNNTSGIQQQIPTQPQGMMMAPMMVRPQSPTSPTGGVIPNTMSTMGVRPMMQQPVSGGLPPSFFMGMSSQMPMPARTTMGS